MARTEHFDATAIALHWTIAPLIVVAFGLGLTVDAFPRDWEQAVVNAHALLGIAILGLTALRLAWRLGHPPPVLPPDVGPFMRGMATIVHAFLYTLMALVPFIGIPTLLYRGRGLDLGLLELGSPFVRTPSVFRPLTEIHELAAYALIALAAAHAMAALYHHFIRRDEVLLQMIRASAYGER